MPNDITNSNLNPAYEGYEEEPFGIPEDPDDLYKRQLDEEQEEIHNGTYEDHPPESLPEEDYIKHLEEDEMLSGRKDNLVFRETNKRDFIYKMPRNRQDNEQEKEIKVILNSYIDDIDEYEKTHWIINYNQLIGENTLGAKISGKQRYIMGFCKILTYQVKDKNWDFSRDGDSIYLYNEEYWMKVDIDLFKEFLRVISNKLNIPEFLYLDYKFIDSIYKQLMQMNFFSNLYHSDNTLINLKNGTLLISSNKVELLDFHPDDGLTYQLDFEYNPNKVNTRFLDFLDDILPNRDTQRTLQEAIGSLFIHFLKLEKVPFLYGTGSNGKSVLFEILKGLVDPSLFTEYSLESLTSSKGYERAELQNKLINYCSDINMKKIDHGIFKQLASGEPIQVRPIYKQPFIMSRYSKMIFNINKIDDAHIEQTIGFFRRMIFIPFEKTILPHQQDKNLHKKILRDKSGILNWIIEGIEEVLKNQEIFISKRCNNFLDKFMKESNIVNRFVEEYSIVSSINETVGFQPMYDGFIKFCKNEGERTISKYELNTELRKLEFKEKRRSKGMVWLVSFN